MGTDESRRHMKGALGPVVGLGKTEYVCITLVHGAEINAPGACSGRTVLQEACAYGVGFDMIDLLVLESLSLIHI